VIVVGGGSSGRRAAADAAGGGASVILVDERGGFEPEGYELLAPARAIGIYEGGLVPVDAGAVLYRVRASRIVVATGTVEQPLVFPGNDLVGVMLPDGARRLIRDWAIRPGGRAVVVAADDDGLAVGDDLTRAGTEVARVVDIRKEELGSLAARGKKGRLAQVLVDGTAVDCDLLVASGVRQPAYSLLAQAGGRVEYDAARGIFVPAEIPAGIDAVGSVAAPRGDATVPAPTYAGGGDRCFVCICEDVTVKDLKRAVAEGFDSIELAKRYTTVTMGPCQGKLCHLASVRVLARETRTAESAIGATTARPPWEPVELGLLAGRHHEPLRRSPLHFRHEERGADMTWAGPWRRPLDYGDVPAEVRAVHQDLGVIDVSTLGKLIVEGPDAGALLDRLYPNRFSDLAVGRIRYGVLTTDGGRIMDDGTVARLADDLFYVTTTSSGSDAVYEWFEWWNAVWGYDVELVNVTGALAAINLAGPRAGRGTRQADRVRRLRPGAPLPRCARAEGRGGAVPRPAHRLRRRARLRAPLPGEHGRASLGRSRRRRCGAVRARAAARAPPGEGARDRRPGHRLRVQPALGRDAVAAQARQERLRWPLRRRARAGARRE
jgi:sarcosine oxidase subunit alpha